LAAPPDLGRIVRSPVIFDLFQPCNFARLPINTVAIDYWTRFGVSAAAVTLLLLSAHTVTIEAAAKLSAQNFNGFLMVLLRSIEIHGHRLVKQENYRAKRIASKILRLDACGV
jgi:hypothetical protein